MIVQHELEAEVGRLRRALASIVEYGQREGHLLDGWDEAMRGIARDALGMDPGCALCEAGHVPARACGAPREPASTDRCPMCRGPMVGEVRS